MYAVAATVHVGVTLLVHLHTGGGALFPDAAGYDRLSGTLAERWEHGGTVDVAALVGSQVWGFPVALGVVRYLTGGGWLVAKVALSLVGATAAVAAYLLVVDHGTWRRARFAGLAIGLSPNLVLLDAWGLKDGLLVALVLWVLVLQTRTPLWGAVAATVAGTQLFLYLRPPAAVFVAAALLPRLRLRRAHVLTGTLLLLPAVPFVLPRMLTLVGLVPTLSLESGPVTFASGVAQLGAQPWELGKFLFAPFPWAYGPGTANPQRWTYLGTTIWIACLVLAPATVRAALRDRAGWGRAALAGAAAYTLVYLAMFGAEFYRQRSLLEIVLLLLVAGYLPLTAAGVRTRLQVWFATVAGLAVLQSDDLVPHVAGKTAVLATAAVVALLGVRPLRARLVGWIGTKRRFRHNRLTQRYSTHTNR